MLAKRLHALPAALAVYAVLTAACATCASAASLQIDSQTDQAGRAIVAGAHAFSLSPAAVAKAARTAPPLARVAELSAQASEKNDPEALLAAAQSAQSMAIGALPPQTAALGRAQALVATAVVFHAASERRMASATRDSSALQAALRSLNERREALAAAMRANGERNAQIAQAEAQAFLAASKQSE